MNNTFEELDSFTAGMLKRTRERQNMLQNLLRDEEEDENVLSSKSIVEKKSVKENEAKVPMQMEESSEDDEELDEELLNDNNFKRQVRESIHKLLNVHEPVGELPVLSPKKSTATRLHQRLNRLSTMYQSEDTPKVLTEKNSNTEAEPKQEPKKLNLKDRLNEIAKSYYPVNADEAKPSKAETKKELSLNTQSESSVAKTSVASKAELFKYKSVAYEKKVAPVSEIVKKVEKIPEKEPVLIQKKNSVSDLKKIFEAKAEEANATVVEKAPELLSLREKRRLFEKEIVAQNEARSKQYNKYKSAPLKRIADWQQKQVEEPVVKRQPSKIEIVASKVEPIEEEKEVLKEEVAEKEESVVEETPAEDEMEEEVVAIEESVDEDSAQESVGKAFETIDNLNEDEITFSELEKSHKSNMTVSLEMDRELSDGAIHRSSTKVDLGQNDSIPPEKPARLYLDSEPPVDEPPIRTISFYRREQKMRKEAEQCHEYIGNDDDAQVIHLQQNVASNEVAEIDVNEFKDSCEKKIDNFQVDISEHNRISMQARHALSMSLMVPDLQYSPARIEAERLLLISEEHRMACKSEIAKLRSMIKNPEVHMNKVSLSTGSLYITNLRVPLRNDFVVSRAKGKLASVRYFLCLIVHGSKIFVSDLLSTDKNVGNEFLEFNFGLNVTQLQEEFNVVVKLYSLELIKEPKQSKRTPLLKKSFKMKFGDSHKSVASPAPKTPTLESSKQASGSNFKLMGLVTLNLATVQQPPKFFRLESFSFDSPLDGYITMRTKLSVTHQFTTEGFFDMKDLQTTYWNVRWFVLRENQLLYWRFRDDMDSKPPLGCINLKHCINPSVGLLKANQRHLCMRPNTLILVALQPPVVSNAQKLVKGGTITKPVPELFFISSQSKSDIVHFCSNINQALRNIRLWETNAVRPYSAEELDRLILNSY